MKEYTIIIRQFIDKSIIFYLFEGLIKINNETQVSIPNNSEMNIKQKQKNSMTLSIHNLI